MLSIRLNNRLWRSRSLVGRANIPVQPIFADHALVVHATRLADCEWGSRVGQQAGLEIRASVLTERNSNRGCIF